jgi:hypothetical protein
MVRALHPCSSGPSFDDHGLGRGFPPAILARIGNSSQARPGAPKRRSPPGRAGRAHPGRGTGLGPAARPGTPIIPGSRGAAAGVVPERARAPPRPGHDQRLRGREPCRTAISRLRCVGQGQDRPAVGGDRRSRNPAQVGCCRAWRVAGVMAKISAHLVGSGPDSLHPRRPRDHCAPGCASRGDDHGRSAAAACTTRARGGCERASRRDDHRRGGPPSPGAGPACEVGSHTAPASP